MDAFFKNCQDRLARVTELGHSAAALWNDLDLQEVCQHRVRIDSSGNGELFFSFKDSAEIRKITLILGEVLYHLRAALDGLIYDASILCTKRSPPPDEKQLEFPITPCKRDFASSQKSIKHLSEALKRVVEELQPFPEKLTKPLWSIENEVLVYNRPLALKIVHDWARVDRHRRLHLLALVPASIDMQFILPKDMSVHDFRLVSDALIRAETKVADFFVSNYTRGTRLAYNPNTRFDVALDELPRPADKTDTMTNRFGSLISVVDEIRSLFVARM